jgi:predicted nucleic acid-binding protein
MISYMLDTNIASHVIKGDRPELRRRLASLPMEEMVISAVTEGELLHSLSRRNYPAALTERVRQFLLRVDVLAWDHDVTRVYADLRASCEARGHRPRAARHDDCSACGCCRLFADHEGQSIFSCFRSPENRRLDRAGLRGPVAELVGIEVGVVSGVMNLESSGVEASDWRPRHEEVYHDA